jgi:alkaline phosphatase
MRSTFVVAVLSAALALVACGDNRAASDAGPGGDVTPRRRPVVILMVGDGMGPGQIAAASLYAHGADGQLFLHTLPVSGQLNTASLSGTTDSCAAATTMATGARTLNYMCGVDRRGQAMETLVERAHALGLSAGVATTAAVVDATPAAFTAHRVSRAQKLEIAWDQTFVSKPDVILGGGVEYFLPAGEGSARSDEGLTPYLEADGYELVRTADELAGFRPGRGKKLAGFFGPGHLDYVLDRPTGSTQPTLRQLALAALAQLDTDPDGFFLMIEGARIDMASHGNDAPRAIHEMLAFDDAIRAVAAWTAEHPDDDVTLLVVADHECGGLTVTGPPGAPGEYPRVAWRWGNHTNTRIEVHGMGPGAAPFAGAVRDHTWVHAALLAAIEARPFTEPPLTLAPDGDLADLRHLAATQTLPSAFGPGYNELGALYLDADGDSLALGVEGVFEWNRNAVVVLIDVDYGAGTGAARLADALSDVNGLADGILSGSSLGDPGIAGFGADFAFVAWGGSDPKLDQLDGTAGLRGLYPPVGKPEDLGWYAGATNFADGTRTRGNVMPPAVVLEEQGWEVHVPWNELYPTLAGGVPAGATLAIAVVLVNDDGGYTSNQALPPFPDSMVQNPGRAETPLPGVVVFAVDEDLDGVADGDAPPAVVESPAP